MSPSSPGRRTRTPNPLRLPDGWRGRRQRKDEVSREIIQVIACERPRRDGQDRERRYIAVRWASHPTLGMPDKGYALFRRELQGAQRRDPIGTFFLPRTGSWRDFEVDAHRRQPNVGPYFPAIEERELGYLLPIIRLVDPRTPTHEWPGLTDVLADYLGGSHEEDEECAWQIWQHGTPPPLADLLANPATAVRVIRFYREQALNELMLLALRFEYAALFGLGIDDLAPIQPVVYEVEGSWNTTISDESDPVHTNSPCAVAPPDWLRASRAPGTVSHPAFRAWPDWRPPVGLAPTLSDGTLLPAGVAIPRPPAPFTALNWAAPPPESSLIGYGPVLYLLDRYKHPNVSPGELATPALPRGAAFAPIVPGQAVARPDEEPHYLDSPGMDWPPLEGHYHYQVRSLDLLGTVSEGTTTTIRQIDDLRPPAPSVRLLSEPLATLPEGATELPLDLAIDWDAAEDFGGPDAREFRVDAHWIPRGVVALQVLAAAEMGELAAELKIAQLRGTVNQFAGLRLSLPQQDHLIVSHTTGAPATMIVRKSAGRMPLAPADGLVFSAGAASARTRVSRIDRRPVVPVTVTGVRSLDPLEISLAQADAVAIPGDAAASVYLQLLRSSFAAGRQPDGNWQISQPPADRPAAVTWERWQAMANAEALLVGSPALVFPQHAMGTTVSPPAGFEAGLLVLSVTAADGADYVSSPSLPVVDSALANLTGNESGATQVLISVCADVRPAAPVTPAWNPDRWIWASSASNYAEEAEYDVTWTASPGAVRYAVWRALEGAVPGVTTSMSDAELRDRALADADAFALRSDQVFTTRYRDHLPGRAPTRAVYRVQAIGLAGLAGPPSDLIGPVRVPDVRQPPPPNLLPISAVPPEEGDRTVAVEWTQSGPLDDLRFDVYLAPGVVADRGAFTLASSLPRGAPPAAGGRFRVEVPERPPGKPYSYRVIAVREARDPIDDLGATRRDIASLSSEVRSGIAVTAEPLHPPINLSAQVDAPMGTINLTWQNDDDYETIEVWRRHEDRYAHRFAGRVAGSEQTFIEPLADSGTWYYQLRAKGVSREVRSAGDVQVVLP